MKLVELQTNSHSTYFTFEAKFILLLLGKLENRGW
jgi:hypothetical protein